jgi:hypothetical protein
MSRQSTQKQGKQSTARKTVSTRHPCEPAPSTSPVPGAFSKEGELVMPDGHARSHVRPNSRCARSEQGRFACRG